MEIGTAGTRKDTQRSPKLLNGSGDGFVLTVQNARISLQIGCYHKLVTTTLDN
jgi:hypothetical protein